MKNKFSLRNMISEITNENKHELYFSRKDEDLVINEIKKRKKGPSLKEMLTKCDQNSESDPELNIFISSPPVGNEII